MHGSRIALHSGEWWNGNVFDLERNAFLTGNLVPQADAYTINGKPGDLHRCSGGSNRRPSKYHYTTLPGSLSTTHLNSHAPLISAP